MALVSPTISNKCRGTHASGEANIQLKCAKSYEDDSPVYGCVTWRYFRVSCPKLNQQCSSLSGAYVPAITVCQQRLF